MNDKNFLIESQTDWERLENMKDEEIDLSDMPELTAEEIRQFRPGREVLAEHGIVYDAVDPYTVTVHHEDGSTSTHTLPAEPTDATQPQHQNVTLAPDVSPHFADSAAVNRALRALLRLQRELASSKA